MHTTRHGFHLTFILALAGCAGDEAKEGGSGGATLNLGGNGGKPSGSSGGGSPNGGSPDGGSPEGGSTRGGSSSGGTGMLPLGAICAISESCSQAEGEAVCCTSEGCTSPCECVLANACPGSSSFLPCESAADCAQFGGGKVCCSAPPMQYCTKQSGCAGDVLP